MTAEVDERLAALPEPQRRTLQALRELIQAEVPEARDAITYGIPGFTLRGRSFLAYNAWKEHCALYPMRDEVAAEFASELQEFSFDKGTIRFTPDRPLPEAVVRAIVRMRLGDFSSKR